MTILFVPLDRIQPNPWQTRLGDPDPEYIKDLAMDILANSLLQKPVGRIVSSDDLDELRKFDNWDSLQQYSPDTFIQLAFGHNRLAAYKWLNEIKEHSNIPYNYDSLPVEVRLLDDEQMADFAWSENERRRDVNPYERAVAIEKRMKHFDWTQEQAAEHLRLSRGTVSNILRLLKLPQGILDDLRQGHLAERAALALLPLYDLPQEIIDIAERNWSEVTKPSSIIASARSGQSSELIRERVEKIIDAFGANMQFAEWKLDEKVEHNDVHSLTCRGCHLRLKERNLCLDEDCFDLKRATWRQAYLYLAQHAFDAKHDRWIPLAEDDIDHYNSTDLQYESEVIASTIRVSGCDNLRLIYEEDRSSKASHPASLSDVGYPKAFIVCRRRNGMCTCKNGVEHLRKTGQAFRTEEPQPVANTAEDDDAAVEVPGNILLDADAEQQEVATQQAEAPALSASDLQELARQARKDKGMYKRAADEAKSQAIETFADLLLTNNYFAWRTLVKHLFGFSFKEEEASPEMVELARKVAESVIGSNTSYIDDRELPEHLNKWLASKGLPELTPQTLMEVFSEESEE